MKKTKLIIASVWVLLIALLWSCESDFDSALPPPQDQITDISTSQNLLLGSNSILERMRGSGFGGPIGAIYGNFYSNRNGRTESSITPSMMMHQITSGDISMESRQEGDTTDTDDDWDDWEEPECLTEIWEDDGAGNYRYVMDFGDGCDFYGEFMKGKFEEVGRYDETSFSSTITYTNFGGRDWSIDGSESYKGTWDEVWTESGDTSEVESFTATYEYEADLTETFNEIDWANDSTEELMTIIANYIAYGAEVMDNNGYTITQRTESIDVSTGESFTSQVDAPLFYDFNCEGNDVWIFVSGIESGTYSFEGESGTYSVDYGDGTCDNIITVTENGVTEEVDLEELWEEWEDDWDEDGEGHDDEDCGDDHDEDDEWDDEYGFEEGLIIYTGDVAADGCGWLFATDYDLLSPVNLEEEFKSDSLHVVVEFFTLDDPFYCGMSNDELEQIEIEFIEKL